MSINDSLRSQLKSLAEITQSEHGTQIDAWYVGNSNGANPREAFIDCHFLEKGKSYTATLYTDADDAHFKTNPQAYRIEKQQISSETKLKIFTASGGGFAIQITEN